MGKSRKLPILGLPPEGFQQGRVVTFYSYKGGVGRTSTLANIAWGLSGSGKKLLAVDWDLEAPGLTNYFAGRISEENATQMSGVIDLLCHYRDSKLEGNPALLLDWNSCLIPVRVDQEGGGELHLITTGRLDPAYFTRVFSFDWPEFYEELRGYLFLDQLLAEWRDAYDFVLIDSRTGITEMGSICAVHLPDIVVVMFTYNRQNFESAALVSRNLLEQRPLLAGSRPLALFPVPTRVATSESRLLQEARVMAKTAFSGLPQHLSETERERYWNDVEIPYLPQYSFEERLLLDVKGGDNELAASYRLLSSCISGPIAMVAPPSDKEEDAYEYDVVLSFAGPDRDNAEALADILILNGIRVFYDRYAEADLWGKDLYEHLAYIYGESALYCVMFISQHYADRLWTNHERKHAQARAFQENQEYILPVRLDDTDIPGIADTVAYLDLRQKSVDEVASVLMEKLKVQEARAHQSSENQK